jgi:hypothetical protein
LNLTFSNHSHFRFCGFRLGSRGPVVRDAVDICESNILVSPVTSSLPTACQEDIIFRPEPTTLSSHTRFESAHHMPATHESGQVVEYTDAHWHDIYRRCRHQLTDHPSPPLVVQGMRTGEISFAQVKMWRWWRLCRAGGTDSQYGARVSEPTAADTGHGLTVRSSTLSSDMSPPDEREIRRMQWSHGCGNILIATSSCSG